MGTLLATTTPQVLARDAPGIVLTSTKKDLSWSRFSKMLGERVSRRASLWAALSADSRAGWGSWRGDEGTHEQGGGPRKGAIIWGWGYELP